ncbi:YqjF family protein [Pseudonocardia adelaidensis]|uniref:YqjF family protein n=1 Tax=Pseudonocardia adelaidensis TaxID=648754 RepID=A0ABP9NE86_9PSEU
MSSDTGGARHDATVEAPIGPARADPPPMPRPHLLTQHWLDVAFLHWAVDPDAVRHLLPAGVAPDVADGSTYVGLIPFRLVGTAVAGGPPVPWGTFLETNVRLYSVDAAGRRGVVFRCMAAESRPAVAAGRAVFGLPYRWASMRFGRAGALRGYSARLRGPGPPVRSRVAVAPVGPPIDGPLERFLTARWGLHVGHLGRTWYLPTTHVAWPLRRAEVHELDDGLLAAAGLGDLARRPPDHVAFSGGVAATFGCPVLTAPVSTGRPDNGAAPSG